MRLLNTKSLEFGDFFDSDIPKYAILSHRWEDNEVLYKEFKKGKAYEGPGLKKIQESCALAAKEGYDWIWIDTCCIDKRSSAELSEAINSMYEWYKKSAVCYVYLSDVCYSPSDVSILKDIHKRSLNVGSRSFSTFHEWNPLKQEFCNSSWFGRGWTLQELLAPARCIFFDRHWTFIGDFFQLEADIAEAAGIPRQYLGEEHRYASIAQKMSWASCRKTSRGEDLAYCLLGLFDINMPLLYGEGADKAFYRLQSEILRTSTDESIFAWTTPWTKPWEISGLFAPHPKKFADSGDYEPIASHPNPRPHYTLTNRGLQMSIPRPDVPSDATCTLTMHLYCSRSNGLATVQEEHASRCQAPVIHLFWHEGSYIRMNVDSLQCTLRESHASSLTEGTSDNYCAIYIETRNPGIGGSQSYV